MSEIINSYLLSEPEKNVPIDRDEFYAEQIAAYNKTGSPTRACEIVQVFLFNANSELLIQKRSYDKRHNPGLLDKTIGGHIRYGDTPDYTVMVESVQELQTPSIVLRSAEDYAKTATLLADYLTTIAVIEHIQSKLYRLEKVFDGKLVTIASKTHIYFGVYNGSIRPVDREAKGVLFYTLPELDNEMKSSPDIFTQDIHTLLTDLRPKMEAFVHLINVVRKA